MKKFFPLLLFFLIVSPASAQEQTIVLSRTPRVELTDPQIDTDAFTVDTGARLIQKVFGIDFMPLTTERSRKENNGKQDKKEKVTPAEDAYYVLHALRYGDSGGQEWDGWFVFHKDWAVADPKFSRLLGDPRYKEHLTDPRIFGSKNVRLAYAHMNLRGFFVDTLPQSDADAARLLVNLRARVTGESATSRATAEKVRNALTNESSGDLVIVSDRGQTYSCQPDTGSDRILCLEEVFKDATNISYELKIKKKTPQPVKDFNDLAAFAAGAATGKQIRVVIPAMSLTAYGGGNVGVRYLPSDMDIKAMVQAEGDDGKKTSKDLSKIKIDNEGRYHWNVSFAVPLVHIDELRFVEKTDTSPAGFQPTEISKQRVYGVFNFYPWKIDTKNPTFRIKPGLMAGLAISGKALNQQLYAVSLGIWHVDAFWGYKVNRVELPRTESDTKQKFDITARWTIGVNLPVRTAIGLLTPKKKED